MISFESTTISNKRKLPAINLQSFFKHSADILQTFAITLKSNWKPLYGCLLNLWASYPTGLHSIGIVGRLTRWRMPGYLSRRIITAFQECSKDSIRRHPTRVHWQNVFSPKEACPLPESASESVASIDGQVMGPTKAVQAGVDLDALLSKSELSL